MTWMIRTLGVDQTGTREMTVPGEGEVEAGAGTEGTTEGETAMADRDRGKEMSPGQDQGLVEGRILLTRVGALS